MTAARLASQVRIAALELGFADLRITTAEPFTRGAVALARWRDQGFAGDMAYMQRLAPSRAEPTALLPAARSLLVAALALPHDGRHAPDGARPVARYALGGDYHAVIRERLATLAHTLQTLAGRTLQSRIAVDTAPLLEREAALRSGLAFIGKSTLAIAPGRGSHLLLGVLLSELELEPDAPARARCGRCRACLDACPTQALVEPYTLDARRCIAYLTLEHRGVIPRELRPLLGVRVAGCDACQDACPFNATRHRSPVVAELAPRPVFERPDLVGWLTLTTGDYRRLTRDTALTRIGRHALARNAAVALGNSGDASVRAPLAHALAAHPSALVRRHIAWALGRLGTDDALTVAAREDPDPDVREEAVAALAGVNGQATQTAGSRVTTTGA